MNKLTFGLACGVFATFALGGCKQIAEAKKAAEALKAAASAVQANKSPAISSEEDKDAELGAKLGEYISCMNLTSKRVVDSRNRYLDWVKDDKVGPTGKERNIYGLYDINADSCFKALDRAKTMSPALPEVEAAAAEYRK